MDNKSSQYRGCRFAPLAGMLIGAFLVLSGCSPQAREARYLASGKRMMENKDYSRAVIQFMNAVKVMPKDAEPLYQLGTAYLALHDYQSAAEASKRRCCLIPSTRRPNSTWPG